MDTTEDYYKLTLQQQRFCDEYLMHFNAFKSAANAGYSENTARKGELLHLPKIQLYLKEQMRRTQSRLQITHDMILTELAKIAFSNMGNYFDEYAVLKPMHKLTTDEKAAISQYQVLDATDEYGHRVGELSKIKLHNKMAALDKIARHLGFYEVGRKESPKSGSPEVGKMEEEHQVAGIEYQDEGLESESVEGLKMEDGENMENILTLSPLRQLLNDRMIDGLNLESGSSSGKKQEARWAVGEDGEFALDSVVISNDSERSSALSLYTADHNGAEDFSLRARNDNFLKFALGTEADTGPVAKARAV